MLLSGGCLWEDGSGVKGRSELRLKVVVVKNPGQVVQ
jgi:hypothetical protein